MSEPKHIVLGVTGSIAAYKSADLIRRLAEKNYKISVVMTQQAEQFITAATLAGVSDSHRCAADLDSSHGVLGVTGLTPVLALVG